MPVEPALGWNPAKEPKHLAAIAALQPATCAPMANIPDNLDLADWMQDLQGYWPFCHSHMRTAAEEILYFLTTGRWLSFSRYRAAILDMRADGDDSSPNGASIGGSFQSAIADGACIEAFMPYPDLYPNNQRAIYSNSIPAAAVADAKQRHIKSITPNIRSYSELHSLMVTGRYVFGLGMDWTTSMDNLSGVQQYDTLPSGAVRGGHALAVFGWKKVAGELWPIMHNSQTDVWGVRRRIAFSPHWYDYVLSRSQYGAFGASDIEVDDPAPEPRDLSFAMPLIEL